MVGMPKKALASLMPMAMVVTTVFSPLDRVTCSPERLVNAMEADICSTPPKLISA